MNVSVETEAKVKDLYTFLEFPMYYKGNAIHKVYNRVYIGDYSNDLSAFSVKRYHFQIINIGDCLKCITEQHDQCQPDVHRLLRPYQYKNEPVHIDAGGVKIMGIVAIDNENFSISNFFHAAADFIEETLTSSFHRNVLVLSRNGKSRAPTIVIAYLMLKQHLSLEQALHQVGKERSVLPNFGFMVQLLRLGDKLSSRKTKAPKVNTRQNAFPLRTHPMSDIIVSTRPEAKSCCVLHSYKNIPPSFVYKIVDDRERNESLYTMCAFDRQNF